MARLHTPLPTHLGERRLAEQLANLDDQYLHLWFGLDFIPGVRDIDIFAWHEKAGAFVIEVKAVSLDAVEHFSRQSCKIQKRDKGISPQVQASNARYSMINYLAPYMPSQNVPYLMSTCCWPLISRAEWNATWENESITGEFSLKMIFLEDIASGSRAFRERLEYIWLFPPVKTGAPSLYQHTSVNMERLSTVIRILDDEPSTRKQAPSDLERLRIIEERVANETLREVPLKAGRRVHYNGYPGTGKTFRLLQIGVYHALNGARVLFVCFNKVLAADIRRILKPSSRLALSEYDLDVKDVFDIARSYATGRRHLDGNFDAWGREVVEEMKLLADDLPKYDTILIDESQDMKDWFFQMLELLCAPGATICVASGNGQELYGDESAWLGQFAKSAKSHRLNRNFRNTEPVGKLAQIFFEAATETEKIRGTLVKFKNMKSQQIPMFERQSVSVPVIHNINELPGTYDRDGNLYDAGFGHLVSEYKKIIKDQIDSLRGSERPLDILLLVPRVESLERKCVTVALTELQQPFVDYTKDESRRQTAPVDYVRLCTFHSARGIEGSRVVVFGFEQLGEASRTAKCSLNSLGYVALSRTNFELIVATRPTQRNSIMEFLESSLTELHRASEPGT